MKKSQSWSFFNHNKEQRKIKGTKKNVAGNRNHKRKQSECVGVLNALARSATKAPKIKKTQFCRGKRATKGSSFLIQQNSFFKQGLGVESRRWLQITLLLAITRIIQSKRIALIGDILVMMYDGINNMSKHIMMVPMFSRKIVPKSMNTGASFT